jgi:hypothetical protein
MADDNGGGGGDDHVIEGARAEVYPHDLLAVAGFDLRTIPVSQGGATLRPARSIGA